MKSYRAEVERLTPQLRLVARALVDGQRADIADDLVHEAIVDGLREERSGLLEDVAQVLYARVLGANRARLRQLGHERHPAPTPSASGQQSRAAQPLTGFGQTRPSAGGLDMLTIGDREALVLAVLAQLDYNQAAAILAIPVATLVTRLTRARDTLGETLGARAAAAPPGGAPARRPASHLRLVKS